MGCLVGWWIVGLVGGIGGLVGWFVALLASWLVGGLLGCLVSW